MTTTSHAAQFEDIAPYDNSQFRQKMAELVEEPGLEHAVKYVMPDVDYPEFVKQLLSIPDKETFQTKVMAPFLELLAHKTSTGISANGLDNIANGTSYTFITNHRDIVLDASFLNLCFLRNSMPTSEVAIGSNLLIYDWITDLVKLNKSFIVKRNLRVTQALEAANQLSAYIHYTINTKHESVWIAQREGRAKDSNDMTQESLVKMLALAGEGSIVDHLCEINLMPVSISYEYDPNDYLKAREFLLKKLNPKFKKSQRDDLFSMETGLLQPKGRIHFELAPCINPELRAIPANADKAEVLHNVCRIINGAIHSGYMIYPINYYAADKLGDTDAFSSHYTPEEAAEYEHYFQKQLDKVTDEVAFDPDNRRYMLEMMFRMYANPLLNKLAAQN